ncbi:MAG TPA: NAD(P)H-dependent glycerol-3-phosphate dehydrogenase, partial [Candidatus Nanoarchaeia archaeon]|nr:NAD(P)H-dependent glycerol-3-phosphate dehydrogenase [Candidatus Nanoarchaeia archaeon]
KEVLTTMDLVMIAVPSTAVEVTLEKAKPYLRSCDLMLCSKGFARGGKLLSEVAQSFTSGKIYYLSGPTHAEELGAGKFSGMVLAGPKGKEKLKQAFESKNLKVELSEDIIGAQVCAALKNVIALFVGILDGMKWGDNAKAYIMTKGLGEIRIIGRAMGAQENTFMGLAGMGDLIVTCSSKHSRNRYVGVQIGKGKKLSEVLTEMKMVAEGLTAVKEALKLGKKYKLKIPLIKGLHQIVCEGKDPQIFLQKL